MKTIASLASVLLIAILACPVIAPAAQAPRPSAPPSSLSLQEARVIIDGAVAYARENKMQMTVVIVDNSGQLISADRMETHRFILSALRKGKRWHLLYCEIVPRSPPNSPRPVPIAISAS